jgi:hypothetical protein
VDLDRFELDLASYQIQKNKYAFGIRQQFYRYFYMGSQFSEILYLFRFEKEEIEKIAELLIGENDTDSNPADEMFSYLSVSCILVSSNKTNGFYDLIVKETENTKQSKQLNNSYILKWDSEKKKYE